MGGVRIGSIFGLEIRIDYSWLVIFFLVLWTFTVGVFPMQFPGLDRWMYVAMGVSGTFLFFLSVLLHELAHSVVAQAKGIPVEGITLFIFGGMAHTRMEFENPKDEFLIAGAGPVSSVAIAGAFALISGIGTQLGWSVAITGVAGYLAVLNLILAIFNMLPGFPLDGGRLFRAAIWHYTGDLTKATRIASTGGKWLGYMLMALGLLQIFAGLLIGGLWLIFIGWFVRMAAEATYVQHLLSATLEGVRASQAMTSELQTVPPHLTLREFVDDYVFRGRHEAYPVTDEDDHPLGIIAFRQIKEVPQEEWPQRTVADTMTALDDQTTVRPETKMTDVLEKIQTSKTRRVLVVRDGHLMGIITGADLARWMDRARMLQGR
jgi:Zn-dependent protease/CBS domain-containing protein